MQMTVAMLVGLLVGGAVFFATRRHPTAAAYTALTLGVLGSALFITTINGWFLPDLGRFGMIGIGLLSGIATTLAVGCLVRGERKPINWVALAFAAPPVLFLIVFGIAELLGPSH